MGLHHTHAHASPGARCSTRGKYPGNRVGHQRSLTDVDGPFGRCEAMQHSDARSGPMAAQAIAALAKLPDLQAARDMWGSGTPSGFVEEDAASSTAAAETDAEPGIGRGHRALPG